MPAETVILHGWSDCSQSFVDLKRFLVRSGLGPVETVYYGDYESREDNLTFDDVADGLNDEFIRLGFIDLDGCKRTDLNVIVHSTGGLVIRHWLWRYYLRDRFRPDECPVRRVVMLAPANFGSPLAHRGKSFLGHLFKGRWKIGDLLEVGRSLLEGLELGSPYQWNLAHRDLLVRRPLYTARRIQLTVLVGGDDYQGLRGWVNKPGTDGTVVIAGTSIDTVKFILDCCRPRKKDAPWEPYHWHTSKPLEDFAFGVLPGLDHGSIVSEAGAEGTAAGSFLLRALRCSTVSKFRLLQKNLGSVTEETYADGNRRVYQQFLLHAIDDQGNPIPDFTIEFFCARASRSEGGRLVAESRLTATEKQLSEQANKLLTSEFHTHSRDASYRRFLVAPEEIREFLEQAKGVLGSDVVLSMRVHVPRVDKGIEYDIEQLQNIVLLDTSEAGNRAPKLFYPNTTTLLELQINRLTRYVSVGLQPKKH